MASKVGNLVLDLSTRLSLRTGAVSCKSFVGGGGPYCEVLLETQKSVSRWGSEYSTFALWRL